ncbi:MAG: hypothetical protein ABW000_24495 [Actinoplanes sp.]
MIDLDRPAPAERRPRTRLPLKAVALLLAGAVLGGALTYGWTSRRKTDARDQEVSVFVFAGTSEVTLAPGSVVADGKVTSITLTRRVTIVNAGPAPINVVNFAAGRPGVTVRGAERQRWIEPGATTQSDADVQINCARGLPLGRLPVTLSVQTYDERSRQARAEDDFDGAAWSEDAESVCAGDAR